MPPRTPSLFNFEALIEDLFAQADQDDDAPKPSHPISINSLEAAWELAANARRPLRSSDRRDERPPPSLYGDENAEMVSAALLDPNKIGGELGLSPEASEADVAALRREFALRNHPDRVPAQLRDLATQRMMIANDLIDRYVARLRKV